MPTEHCTTGQVVGLQGDRALVQTLPPKACDGCAHHDGCGELGSARTTRQTVEVLNPAGACVGDTVALELAPRGLLTISALLYLFPATAALLGAALGAYLGPVLFGPAERAADAAAVVFLLLSLGASLALLRWLHPRLAEKRSLRVAITGVVAQPADDTTVEGCHVG